MPASFYAKSNDVACKYVTCEHEVLETQWLPVVPFQGALHQTQTRSLLIGLTASQNTEQTAVC